MLVHPNFSPVALDLGVIQIHWYGLMYLCAFAFSYWIFKKFSVLGKPPLPANQVDDAVFYGAMGVIIGGRFGYVFFYGFDHFLEEPLWLFKVWEGGMSFHGGFIGVVIAAIIFAKRHQVRLGELCDRVALAAPMGLGFGRLGNFIGQELWGRPTDVPWGMMFPNDPSGLARHPSQLYQMAMEGVLLFLIIYWFTRKERPEWSAGAMFVMCYGIFRFVAEFFRQPDAHIGFDLFGWLSRGQVLSLPMIALGVAALSWAYWREAKQLKSKKVS